MQDPTFREDWERNKLDALARYGCMVGLALLIAASILIVIISLGIYAQARDDPLHEGGADHGRDCRVVWGGQRLITGYGVRNTGLTYTATAISERVMSSDGYRRDCGGRKENYG